MKESLDTYQTNLIKLSHLIKQYFISQTQNLPNIVEEQETVKTEEENTDNIQNGK